jgi:hypothetical protein
MAVGGVEVHWPDHAPQQREGEEVGEGGGQ